MVGPLGKWTIFTISRKTFFKCWQVWSHGTSHSFRGPSGIQFGLQFCFYGESYNCQLIGQGREKSLFKCKWCCCWEGTKCYIFLESSHTSKKRKEKRNSILEKICKILPMLHHFRLLCRLYCWRYVQFSFVYHSRGLKRISFVTNNLRHNKNEAS